jgi:glycosyltransferase involved in cell wall biosynthesis
MPSRQVSVIVPTFNRAHYLRQCLESLIEQSIPAREIIVIDDGSEDDTETVVASYSPRVRYLWKANGGKASALNFGIPQSIGNLIWVFDDDDIAFPYAIEHRLTAWCVNPEAGFVYGPHLICMEGPDGALRHFRENCPGPYDNKTFFPRLLIGCFFHLNTCLFRREVFDVVRGFDEDLKRGQDYDFQVRMARRFQGVAATKPIFIFRRHKGLRGDKSIRHRAEDRDKALLTFSTLIGKKIRADLHLEEYLYLPRRSSMTASERITALLSRMVAMGSKGYIEASCEDLIDAVKSMEALGVEMQETDRKLIQNLICQGHAPVVIDQKWRLFTDCVKQLRSYAFGRQVTLELAKGLVRLAKSYPNPWRFRLRALLRGIQMALFSYSKQAVGKAMNTGVSEPDENHQ